MSTNVLILDKLAAETAQGVVQDVLNKAQEDIEREQKKEKTPEEKRKAIQALQKKRIETLERLSTKTLGVLQAQGVYACMLFLYSRSGEEAKVAPTIRIRLLEMLKSLPAFTKVPEDDAQKALQFFSTSVAGNTLDTLLLVRDLYEQTLIYARYGAKAAKGE